MLNSVRISHIYGSGRLRKAVMRSKRCISIRAVGYNIPVEIMRKRAKEGRSVFSESLPLGQCVCRELLRLEKREWFNRLRILDYAHFDSIE